MLENIGLLVALLLLMYMALKGVNIFIASITASAVVVLTNSMDPGLAFGRDYTTGPLGAFSFAGKFFWLFFTGAIFGRIMAETHAASSVAMAMSRLMGKHNALWIITLACGLLTYGGVVVFIVIFTIYPLGLRLVQEANIPKRLLCGAAALGAGTFTLTALPGTPSIHNVIAASALGTDLYAAPMLGVIAAGIMLFGGMWYLKSEQRKAALNGEMFEAAPTDVITSDNQELPHWLAALAPIFVVLGMILLPTLLVGFYEDLGSAPAWLQFAKKQGILWPSFSLAVGSLLCVILFSRFIPISLRVLLGKGSNDCFMPLLNTSAVIGFGGVVSQTSGFASFIHFFQSSTMAPELSAFLAINTLSAVVGSSSGGLQIFMNTMADHYINSGVGIEELHRIVVVASGGLDSLPHCGAVIAFLTVMGLTHKQAYKDMAMVTVVFPIIASLTIVGLSIAF